MDDLTELFRLPRSLLMELKEYAEHMEEIVATLEELGDRGWMQRIRSGLKDYEKGHFIALRTPRNLFSLLR